MQPTIMITNGGDHPPQKWAEVTARHITDLIQIEDDKVEDSPETVEKKASARTAKRRFDLDLNDALLPHHKRNQDFERDKLKAHGDARIAGSFSTYDRRQAIIDKIKDLTAGGPFAEHFANTDVQQVVAGILDKHFAHVKVNARRWAAHKDPSGPNAKRILDPEDGIPVALIATPVAGAPPPDQVSGAAAPSA
jgi:hypothetical protein